MNHINIENLIPEHMKNIVRIRISKETDLGPVHSILKDKMKDLLENIEHVEFSFKRVEDQEQNIKNMNQALFSIISYEAYSKFNTQSSSNKSIARFRKDVELSKIIELLEIPDDETSIIPGGRIYGKPKLNTLNREELVEFRSIQTELNDIEYQVFGTTKDDVDALMTLQNILRNRNNLQDWPDL